MASFSRSFEKPTSKANSPFSATAHPWKSPAHFNALPNGLKKSEWVVYSKPPFGGPQQVLKYLSRYTHRVAISNSRLISLKDGQVSFRWRNYRNDQINVMTIGAVEFLRPFLQHVLPPGFVKIRHFGWLANRCRKDKLAHCRRLLSVAAIPTSSVDEPTPQHTCPVCRIGFLRIVGWLATVGLSQTTTCPWRIANPARCSSELTRCGDSGTSVQAR